METWHPSPLSFYARGSGPQYDMAPYYLTALISLAGPIESIAAFSARPSETRHVYVGPLAGTEIPAEVDQMVREPYTRYLGEQITDTPMKVKSVLTENFWFEIIQPLGDYDPWARWLKDHGTSVCSVCLVTNGPLEKDEEKMASAGYASLFKQEKGHEAYEYFDTAKDLGTLLEMKEIYGRNT